MLQSIRNEVDKNIHIYTALAYYREIVGKLHELYQKQAECKEEAKVYDINPFGDIFDLCRIFRSILEKYLAQESPNDEKKNISPKSYFNMGLVSAIHELCNDKQFEQISELELYAILNNHPKPVALKIKSGEKTRFCYIIHQLSEKLKGGEKVEWRSEMLRRLNIAESYYASKVTQGLTLPCDRITIWNNGKILRFGNPLRNNRNRDSSRLIRVVW